MTFFSRRMWLLAGAAAMFAGGALGVACSNGTDTGDGGPDSSLPDGGAKDSATDTKTTNDSGPGKDSSASDSSTPTTCEAGVSGACDMVAQNCGSGKECAVVQVDGGYMTTCVNNASGTIKEGYACTPSPSSNPCVAGLECVSGRCSKHCCLGDNTACGQSHPENYAGRCDLSITLDGKNPAYAVCTYSPSCEPFNLQPCTGGQVCILQDNQGTATCTDLSGADAGEGKSCQFANDCSSDGMICVGNLDGGAGSLCYWECYNPPGPFDAGIQALPAGKGGCPGGEICKVVSWGNSAPAWLGLCSK